MKYATEEDRLEAARESRRRSLKKYYSTPKGKAYLARKRKKPNAVAYQAQYRTTDKYRARMRSPKVLAYLREYRAREMAENPDKPRARAAVKYARRKGRIVKPNSAECGHPGRVEAHHHLGYAQEHWLDVQWLCAKCHKAAHR